MSIKRIVVFTDAALCFDKRLTDWLWLYGCSHVFPSIDTLRLWFRDTGGDNSLACDVVEDPTKFRPLTRSDDESKSVRILKCERDVKNALQNGHVVACIDQWEMFSCNKWSELSSLLFFFQSLPSSRMLFSTQTFEQQKNNNNNNNFTIRYAYKAWSLYLDSINLLPFDSRLIEHNLHTSDPEDVLFWQSLLAAILQEAKTRQKQQQQQQRRQIHVVTLKIDEKFDEKSIAFITLRVKRFLVLFYRTFEGIQTTLGENCTKQQQQQPNETTNIRWRIVSGQKWLLDVILSNLWDECILALSLNVTNPYCFVRNSNEAAVSDDMFTLSRMINLSAKVTRHTKENGYRSGEIDNYNLIPIVAYNNVLTKLDVFPTFLTRCKNSNELLCRKPNGFPLFRLC